MLSVASSAAGHSVVVTWQDNSDDETGFTMEAREAGGTWEDAGTADADVTSFTVTGLDSLTDYEFRVTANQDDDEDDETPPPPGSSSPPSDPVEAMTPDGGGRVFDGYRIPVSGETTGTWDDVTYEWSGNTTDGQLFDDTITLTLDNLPEHYGLAIQWGGMMWGVDDEGEPRKIEVEVDGQTWDLADSPFYGIEANDLFPHLDHTGDSVTITFTGSHFTAGWWDMDWMTVSVLRYQLSVDATPLTIGREEEVLVRATKADGTPAANVNVTVEKPENLEAEGGVTTGANGIAFLAVKGLKLGAASLTLTAAAGGGRTRATFFVGPYHVVVQGEDAHPASDSFETFGVGQTTHFAVKVYADNGVPLDNRIDSPPLAQPTYLNGASLGLSWSAHPNDHEIWLLFVTCKAQRITSTSMYPFGTHPIDVSYPKNPSSVPPAQVFVHTTKNVLTVTPATRNFEEGEMQRVVATVVNSDSFLPVPGVWIDATITPDPGWAYSAIVLQPGVGGFTDANGKVIFWLTTEDLPYDDSRPWNYTATFTLGTGTDAGAKGTVSGWIT